MQVDTLILGAGAAGLMCAAHAGGRVLVVDHAKSAGEKIRISGGGRCNFTNLFTTPENFLSQNPHFCKSALSLYSPWDFLALVERYDIAWHEKTLGQLFCDGSAKQIVAMLLAELDKVGAQLWLRTEIGTLRQTSQGYDVTITRDGTEHLVQAKYIVVATGGKSIPKMGATGLAYQIAEQFGIPLTPIRPGLVPLTFSGDVLDTLKPMAGLAAPARARAGDGSFDEALLFTHRGLSGPAILQISSFWSEGQPVTLSLCPDVAILQTLQDARKTDGRRAVATALGQVLPKALAQYFVTKSGMTGTIADQSDAKLADLCALIENWAMIPAGTEGYRTAEVTLGGIATEALSSKTMASKTQPDLYFIGECVDVTGWLGGYNFQWAWASGMAAARAIAKSAAAKRVTAKPA
jgi:predicted Rossmann fold flavoprotein